MTKQLTFEYNGKDYVLEFTRRTVREMESEGFVASDAVDKPATMFPKLFAGAFKAHHPTEKQSVINEIYKFMPNKKQLMNALAEMYADPVKALLKDPEEDQGNVIQWKGNWAMEEDQAAEF